jgi:hypothetical protein
MALPKVWRGLVRNETEVGQTADSAGGYMPSVQDGLEAGEVGLVKGESGVLWLDGADGGVVLGDAEPVIRLVGWDDGRDDLDGVVSASTLAVAAIAGLVCENGRRG